MAYSEKIACSDEQLLWENQSGSSTPRSESTSSTQTSVFSTPGAPKSPKSPTSTETSAPSLGHNGNKKTAGPNQASFAVLPSFANYVMAGNTPYAPGHICTMRDELVQARSRGEFPTSSNTPEDAQTILEDYQHLQRLRAARGDPALPPPNEYNIIKIDIARRIKARDETHGGSASLQEMDGRIQSWMNSIQKEARMLEITQVALQRKGISNPTAEDMDAIAEEFMQIAERTLLDVANPLRMNASRMEGHIGRFDSHIGRFDSHIGRFDSHIGRFDSHIGRCNIGRLDSQLNGISSLEGALTTQIDTLNAILTAQSGTFNGSLTMLNTALGTVQADLHQLTSNLPAIVAGAVQAAVQEQLSSTYNPAAHQNRQAAGDAPPSYKHTGQAPTQCLPAEGTNIPAYVNTPLHASNVFGQQHNEVSQVASTHGSKSRLGRIWKKITGNWGSNKGKGLKINEKA
ncbi:hypothetical protein CPLU01_04958 [Colletotrichum plurivorum]|uniref:Uncharacterized protein n=1 Tax=Colletotrichum plurivorum TaxID=2175906 RepID=A0A8H6KMM2_9PEZI|nr:hypothetical protein CPLU01_04958 [Colletotrichum plurivorum]